MCKKKILKEVYVALGGNIGDVSDVLHKALKKLEDAPEISGLKTSRFYKTTPVSDLPQEPYVNAVCSFKTTCSAQELLKLLQELEVYFGKTAKPKNHPRKIDLDILFFSQESFKSEKLEIPHPRWQERLFVLIPLSDLITEIYVPEGDKIVKKEISTMLKEFSNINNEMVVLL